MFIFPLILHRDSACVWYSENNGYGWCGPQPTAGYSNKYAHKVRLLLAATRTCSNMFYSQKRLAGQLELIKLLSKLAMLNLNFLKRVLLMRLLILIWA